MKVSLISSPWSVLTISVFEPTYPTPLILAISANHMCASSVLLKRRMALRALMHIEILSMRVLVQLIILIFLASFPFMVHLLALHANVFHTADTWLYLVIHINIKDLVTVWSRAKKQIF
jgi:hypothetical protein